MSGFWDGEVILGDLEKGSERIRVREVKRRDMTMVDIRLFWQDKDQKWQPSKRGLSVPLELIGPLVDALSRVSARSSTERQ